MKQPCAAKQRQIQLHLAICLSAALLTRCADSPTEPGDPASAAVLRGQTVNAVNGAVLSGVEVQVGDERAVTTDEAGLFDVEMSGSGSTAARIRGVGVVERRTSVTPSAGERIRLPLIPTTFDLKAFDQMMRSANDRLQRWTTRPPLVVVATVLSFRGGSDEEYTATSMQMSDEEVEQLIAHLTEGLSLLTGSIYREFKSVTVERPAAGERVSARRLGNILVAEYKDIQQSGDTIGYGTWAESDDGSVVGGSMYLDRDFDHEDERRRLLRIHELGHALGYQHVTSRPSIMNRAVGQEPTDFDRDAALIAFQRPPGNIAPDTDPATPSAPSSVVAAERWAPPVP